MKLQNEYLVVIDRDKSAGFFTLCDNEEAFKKFIEGNGDLNFSGKNNVKFNNQSFNFNLYKGSVKGCVIPPFITDLKNRGLSRVQ